MILIILPFTMSTLTDLIDKIDNPELRSRISQEVNRLTKQKKFGLVFEEHLPECTPLYDLKVKKGSTVAIRVIDDGKGNRRLGSVNDTYTVLGIEGNVARCERHQDKSVVEQPLDNLVVVAQFGMPIYPFLKEIDSICNAPDSKLWHTLIEADNYHALQLLVYLYGGLVDCIYIDPPYNSGATDWKYNNDYVDESDSYRHSKWLSMMQRRLKIARQLLNPKDSVLIVTIDEKEYLHLGCLLEETFPEANIQMVSSVINPSGTKRLNEFSRTDEYIFFVMLGSSCPSGVKSENSANQTSITWEVFRRHDLQSKRGTSKGGVAQFYPIYVDDKTHKIVEIGEPIAPDVPIDSVKPRKNCTTVFPIRDNGIEMNWGARPETARKLLSKGYMKVGAYKATAPQPYAIKYLTSGTIEDVENGDAVVDGYDSDGSIIAHYDDGKFVMPRTNWQIKEHNANEYGSKILKKIIGNRFNFPKSLYAVRDCLNLFVSNKPNSLIIDFFAGSGTTLHAVNAMNAADNGNRRCILVTNNEMYGDEAKELLQKGNKPGDEEWVAKGIARYVTWPRTTCSIKGVDVNGKPLEGKYIDTDINMADGFKTNAVFYHLGFLDKNAVALGRQFKELVPLLWMKAGAIGECPKLPLNQPLPKMMVCPENKFAVLIDELYYKEFVEELSKQNGIETVYIVTDSESGYREMAAHLKVKKSFQLYRDYLDNFRINRAAR